MRKFAYASCTLFGRDKVGVLFRAADDYAADKKLVDEIESRFGILGTQVLRYDDRKRGNSRHILIGDGKLQAVSLTGDLSAEHWLKQYLEGEQSVEKLGRLLLMPSANPPQDFKSRGRIVCNCLNVSETEIRDVLRGHAQGDALTMLQQKLKCGTSCGSCVPELKKIILAPPLQEKAAA
jgi:assimilatory nitrate reductase catalytic subunit